MHTITNEQQCRVANEARKVVAAKQRHVTHVTLDSPRRVLLLLKKKKNQANTRAQRKPQYETAFLLDTAYKQNQ